MQKLYTLVLALVISALFCGAVFSETATDDNSAFFQGVERNYIFAPPAGWKLLIEEPGLDGYSFAFVPHGEQYDSSDVIITVTIYTLNQNSFANILAADTAALRAHYGNNLKIVKRDSIRGQKIENLQTFAVGDSSQFVATEMLGYFNGEQEIVIFELNTEQGYDSKKAENAFTTCLMQFKTLVRKEFGANAKK